MVILSYKAVKKPQSSYLPFITAQYKTHRSKNQEIKNHSIFIRSVLFEIFT